MSDFQTKLDNEYLHLVYKMPQSEVRKVDMVLLKEMFMAGAYTAVKVATEMNEEKAAIDKHA